MPSCPLSPPTSLPSLPSSTPGRPRSAFHLPGISPASRPAIGTWVPCPSPSAPAHRAGSSPGPSSPSGPLRSGETKAAVSQSGAGRPSQPYPDFFFFTRQLCGPTPPSPDTSRRQDPASGAPPVPLQEALTCRPVGEKGHGSEAALRSAGQHN